MGVASIERRKIRFDDTKSCCHYTSVLYAADLSFTGNRLSFASTTTLTGTNGATFKGTQFTGTTIAFDGDERSEERHEGNDSGTGEGGYDGNERSYKSMWTQCGAVVLYKHQTRT